MIIHGGQVADRLVELVKGSKSISFMAPGVTKLSLEVPGYKANYGISGSLPFDGNVCGLDDPNFSNVIQEHILKR